MRLACQFGAFETILCLDQKHASNREVFIMPPLTLDAIVERLSCFVSSLCEVCPDIQDILEIYMRDITQAQLRQRQNISVKNCVCQHQLNNPYQ